MINSPVVSDQKTTQTITTSSWYGEEFAGRKMANGKIFNPSERTVAHPNLPFGTQIRVTNLANGKTSEGEVTDRGPYIKPRGLDVSRKMAKDLGFVDAGIAQVKIEVLSQ